MHIQNFDPYDFSQKEIGGVPAYYKNLPWAPCIHIRVVFKTGAFDDPEGKEGLSHFLEHMIFDGSPQLPDKKAIKHWKKLHTLNTWNAWTSHDVTAYWLKCLPENFMTCLIGMKDMIFNSYLRPEDAEKERDVISQEAWGVFQNEKSLSYWKDVSKILYAGHIRSSITSPLGWPESIQKISREDIASWHKEKYGVGNFYIILSGAVTEDHLRALETFVEGLPKVSSSRKSRGEVRKPSVMSISKRADEIGRMKEQAEVSLCRLISPLPETDHPTASLLGKLLQDLLYDRLRVEHSLCYSVSAGIYPAESYCRASLGVKTDEKNVELVQKEFWNIIEDIKSGKNENQFNIAKTLTVEQNRSAEHLSGDIADELVDDVLQYGRPIALEEIITGYEKVTYADVVQMAQTIFDPEYTFTEVILPSQK